jgi:hypothetical protein
MNENLIQQEIFIWFNNNYCLKSDKNRCMIFSVPNDSINAIETKRKINTGLLKGASDLIVILPNKVLFVEIKTEKGVQSGNQKDFQNRIEVLGFEYYVIRSLEQFKNLIWQQINNPTH